MTVSMYDIQLVYKNVRKCFIYKIVFVNSHRMLAKFLTGSTLAVCVIDKTDNYTCI